MNKSKAKQSVRSKTARPQSKARRGARTTVVPVMPVKEPRSQVARVVPKERTGTKQALLLAMLQTSGGATLTAMMETSGWQQHSVRGFLAGVVRRKLGLSLQSDASKGMRVYRIEPARSSPAAKDRQTHSAA